MAMAGFHTLSSSQQTDMAAVSSSFYSCYRCLAYSPPSLLLQSSTIPQADVGNTDKPASLIWIDSLKKRRGVWKHRANERRLCIRVCTGGVCLYPMRRENADKMLSYSWWVSQGKKNRFHTANRARWHLITKGKHKEAPQPAAGLWRDGWGWSRGSMKPIEITSIHSYTTHPILPPPVEASPPVTHFMHWSGQLIINRKLSINYLIIKYVQYIKYKTHLLIKNYILAHFGTYCIFSSPFY